MEMLKDTMLTCESKRYWRDLTSDIFKYLHLKFDSRNGTHPFWDRNPCLFFWCIQLSESFSSVHTSNLWEKITCKSSHKQLFISSLRKKKNLYCFLKIWEEKEVSSSCVFQTTIPLFGCMAVKQDTDVEGFLNLVNSWIVVMYSASAQLSLPEESYSCLSILWSFALGYPRVSG